MPIFYVTLRLLRLVIYFKEKRDFIFLLSAYHMAGGQNLHRMCLVQVSPNDLLKDINRTEDLKPFYSTQDFNPGLRCLQSSTLMKSLTLHASQFNRKLALKQFYPKTNWSCSITRKPKDKVLTAYLLFHAMHGNNFKKQPNFSIYI